MNSLNTSLCSHIEIVGCCCVVVVRPAVLLHLYEDYDSIVLCIMYCELSLICVACFDVYIAVSF